MKRVLAAAAAVALTGLVAAPAIADNTLPNSVTYSGQGWYMGAPEEEDCEDGPGLLWVLAGSKASEAYVYADGSLVGEMTKTGNGNGGAYKLFTPYFDPTGIEIVAYYDGAARNAQFVISHGCEGYVS